MRFGLEEIRNMIKAAIPGLTIKGLLNLNNADPSTKLAYRNMPTEVRERLPLIFKSGDKIGIRWPVGQHPTTGEMIYEYEWYEFDENGRKRKRRSETEPTSEDFLS